MKVWLKTLFQRDTNRRNRGDAPVQTDKSSSKRIIRVFVVNTFELFSCEINPHMKLNDFRTLLGSYSRIPPINQFLMIRTPTTSETEFMVDDIREDAFQALHKQCIEYETFEVNAYLVDKSEPLLSSPCSTTRTLPARVEEVLLNPTALVTFEEQETTWKQFTWASIRIAQQYFDLIRAHDLLHDYACHKLDQVLQQYKLCNISSQQVSAVQKFFQQKIRLDFSKFRAVLKTTEQFNNTEFFAYCRDIFATMNGQEALDSQIKEASFKLFNNQRELQSISKRQFNYNPMNPNEVGEHNDKNSLKMIEIYRRILRIFNQLRNKSEEERAKLVRTVGSEVAFDNTPMAKLLCDLLQTAEGNIQSVYKDMTKLKEQIVSYRNLNKELRRVQMHQLDTQMLKDLQTKYENLLWELLKIVPESRHEPQEQNHNGAIDEMLALLSTISFETTNREDARTRTDSKASEISDWTIVS